jgi:hypothetical protein
MSRERLPEKVLRLVKPQQLRGYALAKGWQRVAGINGKIAVFNHPGAEFDQLIVPMDESQVDYARRVRDILQNLAEFECRPEFEVLNDLLTPEADVVRYRVASKATGRGSIPLIEGIRLLDGARRSILSAACSVINPVAQHLRMSRTEAQQLLNACNLGQTEGDSYAISVSFPLRAVEEDEPLLPGGEPFTRRAVAMLMRSAARIVTAIEADLVPGVFQPEANQPVLSANLCDAILLMQPSDEDSHLDVKASWATTLPPQVPIPSLVRIKHEYFPIIEDISKKLRPAQAPAASLFVGYVDSLAGGPGDDGQMRGEAMISMMFEEQMQPARVDLAGDDWQTAYAALGIHGIVRFRGILHRASRVHRVTEISEFTSVQ